MNADALWPEPEWAGSQVLGIQTKLHQWATDAPTGLPQIAGTRLPRKAMLTWEKGRDRASEACYYASP